MYVYFYKITCLINNKIYIGQTNNPNTRWSKHKWSAKNNAAAQVISRAINKHGIANFIFEVIATCRSESSNIISDAIEVMLINQYDSRNPAIGYNVAAGGNTIKHTDEMNKKQSDGLKKYYLTNISPLKGKRFTKEHRRRISEASFGKPGTNKNRKFSKEWRHKISRSISGKARISSRRFSRRIELKICKMYNDGHSAYYLGNKFNCERSLISDILIRNGVKKRESNYAKNNGLRKITKEQEAEICRLFISEECITRKDLAKKFGCCTTTIRSVLLRNNIRL